MLPALQAPRTGALQCCRESCRSEAQRASGPERAAWHLGKAEEGLGEPRGAPQQSWRPSSIGLGTRRPVLGPASSGRAASQRAASAGSNVKGRPSSVCTARKCLRSTVRIRSVSSRSAVAMTAASARPILRSR
jgi:hypothetical protein